MPLLQSPSNATELPLRRNQRRSLSRYWSSQESWEALVEDLKEYGGNSDHIEVFPRIIRHRDQADRSLYLSIVENNHACTVSTSTMTEFMSTLPKYPMPINHLALLFYRPENVNGPTCWTELLHAIAVVVKNGVYGEREVVIFDSNFLQDKIAGRYDGPNGFEGNVNLHQLDHPVQKFLQYLNDGQTRLFIGGWGNHAQIMSGKRKSQGLGVRAGAKSEGSSSRGAEVGEGEWVAEEDKGEGVSTREKSKRRSEFSRYSTQSKLLLT